MCIGKLIFKKHVSPTKLPHPEEPMNPMATVENIDVDAVLNKWLTDWNVPLEYWDYWKHQIVITIDPMFPYPAGTWEQDGLRYLTAQPAYFNPGVIAHEQAHNSYALLTDEQKKQWANVYEDVKENNAMIKYLFSINSYGLTNEIEGHAEIGRFIGQFMPDEIKHFYPKLF